MDLKVSDRVRHHDHGNGEVLELSGSDALVLFGKRTPGGPTRVVKKHNGKKGKEAKYVKSLVKPEFTFAFSTATVPVAQLQLVTTV
jgi:hypothetical protein